MAILRLIPKADLRPELRQRLVGLEHKLGEARSRLLDLEKEYETTRAMLEIEEGRLGSKPSSSLSVQDVVAREFLKSAQTKETLIAALEHAGFEKPGRSLHTLLINMARGSLIGRDGDEYRLTEKGKGTLSQKAEGALL